MAQGKVFLRDATGLVRELGVIDTVILAIAAMIGPTWIPVFTGEWFLFPGVSIPASFVLIGILAAINGFYYVLISSVIPRSAGGGYVALSRIVHPILGMGMSTVLVTTFILNLGFIADITISVGIAGPLTTFAQLTKNTDLASVASMLSTPTWAFALGTLTIVLVGLVAIAGTRIILIVNRIAFIIGTLGFLAILGILATTTQEQFRIAFNNFAGPGTYESIISTAHNTGWAIPSDWFSPTLLSLPLSFFAILGYAFGTYYAGEIRRVSRTMSVAVVGSILYTGGIFSTVAFMMERSFGSDFLTSAGYLFNAQPGKYPLSVPPWVNTFVGIMNTNLLVNAILIAGYVAWGYFLMILFYFIVSRHFLAWSFDRVFPSALGKVSDRFHSPVVSVVLVGVLAWIALFFYVYLPTILGPVNLAYLFIVALLLDGLAGIALPFKRFEGAKTIGRKVAGIPLISLLGAYSIIFLGGLLTASLLNPAVIGTFGIVTEATAIGAFLVGVLIYLGMRFYHKRHGLDLSLVYKEIPPE